MYDISKYIQPLSFELKNEILKYLYFSDSKGEKIKSINKFINDFDVYVWNELYERFKDRPEVLNYRILKFIINYLSEDEVNIIQKSHHINYSRNKPIYESREIILHLSFKRIRELYNYIMFNEHLF